MVSQGVDVRVKIFNTSPYTLDTQFSKDVLYFSNIILKVSSVIVITILVSIAAHRKNTR